MTIAEKIAAAKKEIAALKAAATPATPGTRGRTANTGPNKVSAAKILNAELAVLEDRLRLALFNYQGTATANKLAEKRTRDLNGFLAEVNALPGETLDDKRIAYGLANVCSIPSLEAIAGSVQTAKDVRDDNASSIALAEEELYRSLRASVPSWVWKKFAAEVKKEVAPTS